MQLWQALILGIIEGISEFLPISSTGHLVLVSHFLGIEQTPFLKTFEIVIQAGAIVAVILLYWKRILSSKKILFSCITAFIPTVVVGFIFYRPIKDILLGNTNITSIALIMGGIVFAIIEYFIRKNNNTDRAQHAVTPKRAFIIGIGQSISVIPGVSRSAASMMTGLLTGLSRKDAVEFSFILAIPTILAASGYDLIKTSYAFTMDEIFLLIFGCLVSFISALITIKWFITFISSHSFIPFAIYRIIIGTLFLLFSI